MLGSTSRKENDDDYLSEFRQKVANQKQEEMEERRQDLRRTRNGFVGTLAGVFLAGVIGWVLLLPRFSGTDSRDIPVIRRSLTPAKIQPNDPGGMEIPNQDKSIYNLVEKKDVEDVRVESLLPQPEAPKMPVIVPEPEEDTKPVDTLQAQDESNDPIADMVEKSSEVEPLQPVKRSEKLEAIATNSAEKINIPQKPTDLNLDIKTAGKAVEKAKESEKVSTVTFKETESKAVEVPIVPAKEKTTEPLKTASGQWQIQLFVSSGRDKAEKTWSNLSSTYGVLSGLTHEVDTTTSSAGATLYRLKAGAFATRDKADQICNEIKKKGGTCWVTNR